MEDDGEDEVFSLQAFVRFSRWFVPVMKTMSRMRQDFAAVDPVKVHGFVSRAEAKRQLDKKDLGNFLLRFSESDPGHPGRLVLTFLNEVSKCVKGNDL